MIQEILNIIYNIYDDILTIGSSDDTGLIIISSLFFIPIFLVYNHTIYVIRKQIRNESLKDFSKIYLNILPNIALKWVEWSKFMFIIGAFSLLDIWYSDIIIKFLIACSYIFLMLDVYTFIYSITLKYFFNPILRFQNKKLHENEIHIYESIDSLNKLLNIDGIISIMNTMKNLKDKNSSIKKAQKLLTERIDQYKSSNDLKEMNELERRIFELERTSKTIIYDLLELLNINTELRKRIAFYSKSMAIAISMYTVYLSYIFVKHFLNIYVSHKIII